MPRQLKNLQIHMADNADVAEAFPDVSVSPTATPSEQHSARRLRKACPAGDTTDIGKKSDERSHTSPKEARQILGKDCARASMKTAIATAADSHSEIGQKVNQSKNVRSPTESGAGQKNPVTESSEASAWEIPDGYMVIDLLDEMNEFTSEILGLTEKKPSLTAYSSLKVKVNYLLGRSLSLLKDHPLAEGIFKPLSMNREVPLYIVRLALNDHVKKLEELAKTCGFIRLDGSIHLEGWGPDDLPSGLPRLSSRPRGVDPQLWEAYQIFHFSALKLDSDSLLESVLETYMQKYAQEAERHNTSEGTSSVPGKEVGSNENCGRLLIQQKMGTSSFHPLFGLIPIPPKE